MSFLIRPVGENGNGFVWVNSTFPYLLGTSTSGTAGLTTFLFGDDAVYFKIRAVNICGYGPVN